MMNFMDRLYSCLILMKNHILHFCLCCSSFPFCAFTLLDLDVVERSLVRDFLSLSWERPPVVAT
jgi:hypothetical protein